MKFAFIAGHSGLYTNERMSEWESETIRRNNNRNDGETSMNFLFNLWSSPWDDNFLTQTVLFLPQNSSNIYRPGCGLWNVYA